MSGHLGKIYDTDYSSDSRLLLSCSQDGHLIIWDAASGNQQRSYELPSDNVWIQACAFSPSTRYIACGGLDNVCSIYQFGATETRKTKKRASTYLHSHSTKHQPLTTLHHHEGYLSALAFVCDEKVVTASGDSTCILWDVLKQVPESVFLDHAGDVTSVAMNGADRNIFVSGSVDATCKLWDIRLSKCVGEFVDGDADAEVNDVCWFPDNVGFASAAGNVATLFDMRAYKQMGEFVNDEIVATLTAVSFSRSGRVLFAGYDDEGCVAWDVPYAKDVGRLEHDEPVSSVQVAPDGQAVLTSSWDKKLRLWRAK